MKVNPLDRGFYNSPIWGMELLFFEIIIYP
jgi:hypothetical protein